ncbi:4'-phosphopantetheinyl transferase family protein [Chamaesiphon minutus]|uniref:Phosphopantetheinyl transferase n=1 Tax=Chamaesiphon minutus (strain ATCC 27169 / PCC 6605) TaxID=1173020 RepID=K9UPA6_CHAP6|nr:4'-phosphopantetheinyl transferase superfamily protein [Chamaesiphon minutus]AFY96650.1 phosphopantetheinyl transferase [Chamaesiphon minutus PCC 6605]
MLMLSERDIHVWSTHLDLERDRVDELGRFLSLEERQRAAKFINPLHGDRWTVARGYLRHILSLYLDLTPAQIAFTYSDRGKPALAKPLCEGKRYANGTRIAGSQIQFNLSHSRDRAVYGISAKYPIGIDIEYIHPLPAADLVDRFFSPAEQAVFHSLPIDSKLAAFFHAWVQKESYLKACGTGLSTPLDRIEVSIDPSTPAAIISVPTNDIWHIQKLEISPEYASAIVIGGDLDRSEWMLKMMS